MSVFLAACGTYETGCLRLLQSLEDQALAWGEIMWFYHIYGSVGVPRSEREIRALSPFAKASVVQDVFCPTAKMNHDNGRYIMHSLHKLKVVS